MEAGRKETPMSKQSATTEAPALKVLEVTIRRNTEFSARNQKARVYFWPKGESVWENLENRRSRPHKEYRKLIPEVLERIGADPEAVKLSWSQKAGCSCGCSPGFIADGLSGFSVHVDVALAE